MIDSVLHEYPYPIAKSYEKLIGARDVGERWNHARYLVEVTLKFTACVAVSQYLSAGGRDERTNAALTCLDRPSLGHWLNILLRCEQFNQAQGTSYFPQGVLTSKSDSDVLAEACMAMSENRAERGQGTLPRASLARFLESYVAYRNRTAGHGSPSRDHIAAITGILEAAASELLSGLGFLRDLQLVHLSEIRLDRHTCIHGLTRLMGTSQVTVPDYVTDVSGALIGHDKKIFLCAPGSDRPAISLHPLAIFAREDVYLLHHSDLRRNVEYICHHTGELYSADRIFEDFKDALGSFLGAEPAVAGGFEPEAVYEESVRMSLVDGSISEQESRFLAELRARLSLDPERAAAIESRITEEERGEGGEASEGASVQRGGEQSAAAAASGNSSQARVGSRAADPKPRKSTRAMFLSYASIGNSFWAEFISRLVAEVQKRGWVLSVVGPDPSRDHDASAMAALVADIERLVESHEPDVIIMVPYPSPTFGSLFSRRFGRSGVPVLTVDSALESESDEPSADAPRPPAIVVDNRRGGELAAEMLLARHGGDGAPQYLVMPGLSDASHSKARVDGFRDLILGRHPAARIRVLPEGRFNRERALSVIRDFIEDANLERYEGIFCCNDDMALGAYAALCEWFKAGGRHPGFAIAGFNNTAEFRSVQSVDPFGCLVGSVDQSVDVYAQTVCRAAETILSGGKVEARMQIEPRLAVPG